MKRLCFQVICMFLVAGATSAHHSLGDIDLSRTVPLSGSVKEFIWANPHVWVMVLAPDEQGNVVEWAIEGPPIMYMVRGGIRKSDLNPGDRVELTFNPRRSNPHHGGLRQLTIPSSGKVFGMGTFAPPAPVTAPAP